MNQEEEKQIIESIEKLIEWINDNCDHAQPDSICNYCNDIIEKLKEFRQTLNGGGDSG